MRERIVKSRHRVLPQSASIALTVSASWLTPPGRTLQVELEWREQVVGGKRGHRRPLCARMFRSSELELPLSPLQRSAKKRDGTRSYCSEHRQDVRRRSRRYACGDIHESLRQVLPQLSIRREINRGTRLVRLADVARASIDEAQGG